MKSDINSRCLTAVSRGVFPSFRIQRTSSFPLDSFQLLHSSFRGVVLCYLHALFRRLRFFCAPIAFMKSDFSQTTTFETLEKPSGPTSVNHRGLHLLPDADSWQADKWRSKTFLLDRSSSRRPSSLSFSRRNCWCSSCYGFRWQKFSEFVEIWTRL